MYADTFNHHSQSKLPKPIPNLPQPAKTTYSNLQLLITT